MVAPVSAGYSLVLSLHTLVLGPAISARTHICED